MNILASTHGDYCHYIVTDTAHADPDRMLTELRRMFGANTIYWRRMPEVVPEDKVFETSRVHPAHCRARFSTSAHEGGVNEPGSIDMTDDVGHIGSLLYPSAHGWIDWPDIEGAPV